MQHGKCCYSEVSLPEEGHGKAVEHFDPKSIFKWLRNDWDNLLLVCPQCNGKKSNLFPIMLTINENETKVVYVNIATDAQRALINPCVDNPEEHLTYVLDDTDDPMYGQIVPRNEDARGRATITVTGIDDFVFKRERVSWLVDTLEPAYRNLLRARNNNADETAYLDTFRQYLDSHSKFSALAREFARAKKLDSRFGLTIPQ